MSIIIERLLYCDGGNECPLDGVANVDGDKTLPAATIRKDWKAEGWIQRGSKDYCQDCAKRIFSAKDSRNG